MPPKPKAAPSIESSPEAINENLGKRVKKLRGDRGWSLEELATASGVSRSMLSEIEREKANPTLTVTFRIARAFGLTLQELIESAEASASKIQVIRASDRAQVYRSDKQCEIRTLSPINLEKDVEFYEMTLRPGGTLRSQAHFEGTREFLTVEDGSVRIESDQNSEELGKGDSGTYRADVPHAIVNTGKGDALVFLVVIYR
ncbi:MAG: XRE family transcriptional regulator [Prosthecobacter sp.]|jgi:transcriptional regulator with XRE-family HTH domain|uniref:helix-turn-helix domain-containing protein n=1 Tax=Prosthecobacter sp. TaxID=1965333 RepID=UPI0037C845EB